MLKRKYLYFKKAGYCLILVAMVALIAACGSTPQATNSSSAATAPASPTMAPTPTTAPTAAAAATPTMAPTAAPTPTTAPAPTTAAKQPTMGKQSVAISGFHFSPQALTISVGTTVIWTNDDQVRHTVTADQGLFNGIVGSGSSFSFTFTKAGTFAYHCNIHPSMTAMIVVK
ncbi:MAG: cupredoxin family copper-binding protein [Chloroflexi bacterium]|nr:cupredoxin family copper-binding protein [Chloroflexota bacterium]